jgi:hypothetical protein
VRLPRFFFFFVSVRFGFADSASPPFAKRRRSGSSTIYDCRKEFGRSACRSDRLRASPPAKKKKKRAKTEEEAKAPKKKPNE